MKQAVLGVLCAGVLTLPAMADVFDDDKQGFMIGVGLGATHVSTDLNSKNGGDFNEKEFGVATSFKLGYGLSDQVSVYYANQVDWYKFSGKGTTLGLTGVGTDYYFDNNSPYYSTAMIGFGTISDIKDNSTSRGFAYELGFGYDIAEHISVEVGYMNINIDEKNVGVDTDSFRMKFNYTWY